MRVSYVGNFAVAHSTETHIAKAWENLGHSVQRIPEQSLHWPDLPSMVDGDLFLWTRTAGFDPPEKHRVQPEALARIDVPKVGYHLDRWWGLDREWWIDDSAFFTGLDLLCTADGGHDEMWEGRGIRHEWFPPAILSDEMQPVEPHRRYTADVAFVGNLTHYGHPEWAPYRQQLWGHLRVWYRGRFVVFPGTGRPQIRGRALASLYATTKVNIGDSCLVGTPSRYWSDRIPETLGRGGFLIHPEVKGLAEQFPHLVTYELGDWDDLHAKIDYALAHPEWRAENAELNREWVRENHTYELRMQRLLSLVT